MSPSGFENLQREYPQFRTALANISKWIQAHPGASFLDPRRLINELPGISMSDLLLALSLLANRGILQRRYKVLSPLTHTFADGDFKTPADIPQELEDSAFNFFGTSDADVVQVFTAGAE